MNDHRSVHVILLSLLLVVLGAGVGTLRAKGGVLEKAKTIRLNVPESDETLTRMVRLRRHLKNLKLQTRYENGHEITSGFTADVGGGRVSADSAINWAIPDGPQRACVQVTDVDAAELIRTCNIGLGGKITSKASGTLDLQWHGLRFRTMFRTLEGKTSLNLGPGSFSRTEYLASLAAISGIPELRQIEFTSGHIDASARDGVVTIRSFVLSGNNQKITCSGTVKLETEEINLRFNVAVNRDIVARSSNPAVRAAMALMNGVRDSSASSRFVEIPLPVTFVGTVAKPELAVDSTRHAAN